MGRSQFPHALVPGQPSGSRRWHPCCRQCLLKGCERWFLPRKPQARFCGPDCRIAARRWRRWLAGQYYRATPNGKEHRRGQSRRYYTRRQLTAPPQSPPLTLELEPAPAAVEAEPSRPAGASTTSTICCQGQRPAEIPKESCGLPCHRPGCYVLFPPAVHSLEQKFCSGLCRQALRRVRQREARLQHRRRLGARPLGYTHRGPP